MKKRVFLFIVILVILINNDLIPQSRSELKDLFYDAESWILYEDYKEALPKYEQLIQSYPGNSNYLYRIGQCYINIPGEKEKAVNYLEEAVKNIDPGYRNGRFRETSAPYDALYHLANAYRINNQLDKALDTYRLFKKNLDPEVYDSVVINLQIKSCLTAKKLMESPVYVRETNLGNTVNESKSEYNPVISEDEKILVFSKSEPFYDAILYSARTNGTWTSPINMNELLKVDRDFYPTSLSKDGKDLYLYSTVGYDGIIYSTRFENGGWTPVVKLNDNINTKFWESHATVSHDNKKLYFTSNRKGTFGGLDIYVSSRDSTGDWGIPVNIGPVINTPYNEDTPFLSEDDKTLFFCSRGHYNMGGYDIFYSTLQADGEWSAPVNAGYPFNSTDDDVFYRPLNEGYEGYFAKYSPSGFGKQDIFRIEIFSDNHPRNFLVKGIARGADLLSSVRVSALSSAYPDRSYISFTDPRTGEFEFAAPHGLYEFTYESDGSEKTGRSIELPLTNPSDTVNIPEIILSRADFTAEFSIEGDKYITVTTGDPVFIPLRVEPRSVLSAEHWLENSLLSRDQVSMTGSTYRFMVVPLVGENKVAFTLTDRFGNIASSDVIISRIKPAGEPVFRKSEYRKVIAESKPEVSEEPAKPDTTVSTDEIGKIPEATATLPAEKGCKFWYLWLLAGAGFMTFLIIFFRYRRRGNMQDRQN
ncbi:MAG: PD40 domain-containing protein [Bacteroidales bacterium]|nr:PD40 domain-containing protein [Bacteroidales bacterium]